MPTYAKALASFLSTFLAGLAVVLSGPASAFSDVTDGQWVALVASSLAAALVVFGIRNGTSSDPTTSTPEIKPEGGYGAVELLIGVLVVVILVLLILRLA